MLRKWYNAEDVNSFESGAASVTNETDVLFGSDSDSDDHEHSVLLQSDSEQEELVATPPDNDEDEILMATDSDRDGTCEEPPAKKSRRYVKHRNNDHQLLFLGKPVCRFAHMRLYSVGSGVLTNLRAGQKGYTMNEGRLQEAKHPSLGVSLVRSSLNKKWPSVVSFFWLLWISSAEILPIKFKMPGSGATGPLDENSMIKDPDFQERYVQNFLGTLERNFDMNPAT